MLNDFFLNPMKDLAAFKVFKSKFWLTFPKLLAKLCLSF